MDKVRNAILYFRASHSELQHLADACGPSASRAPPSANLIDDLRHRVARKLGLTAGDADRHHSASPWRFRIVAKVMKLAKDPDVEVPRWLEEGTPCRHSLANPPFRPIAADLRAGLDYIGEVARPSTVVHESP